MPLLDVRSNPILTAQSSPGAPTYLQVAVGSPVLSQSALGAVSAAITLSTRVSANRRRRDTSNWESEDTIEIDLKILSQGDAPVTEASSSPYWVFVCNPKRWAIDQFFERGIERDGWGIRPADQARFAPGQLGFVRVGVDRRSNKERKGKPKLEPGVYALCEVESEAHPGRGGTDDFSPNGAVHGPGWPTVDVCYLRNYAAQPLTIARLRRERPNISRQLLEGFQAATFPISADDSHAVMELLGENVEDIPPPPELGLLTPGKLAELEARYLNASPEVRERLSRTIERGPIGACVKRVNDFKCQLCAALGRNPIGFKKKNGEPYVEAHHVMPVAKQQIGSLAASNVLTLCANHHREVHFSVVDVFTHADVFEIRIEGQCLRIPRFTFELPNGAGTLM
jgi:predicted RNA-binding protein with PUA-like domain